MELRQLEAFAVVADELHFGRAAQRLHMSQPSLSELVRRLEREVGTALLHRTTRRVTLTSAGADLRQRAQVILGEVTAAAEAMHRWADGDVGDVRLGITPPVAPVLAPHLAARLRREAPDVDLHVRRMWLPDLTRALTSGRVDVAITCGRIAPSPGITSEVICGEPWLVSVRSGHRLADRDAIALTDLAGATLGMHSETLFPAWTLAQWQALGAADVAPDIFELEDTDLSASRWTSQTEVDWVLTTATVATPPVDAVTRPLAPAQVLPFTLMWAPGRERHPGVGRLVRLARTCDMPAGWTRRGRPETAGTLPRRMSAAS